MTVEKILVGFDIGSVSINSLVCTTTKGERGSTFKIVWEPTYRRHFGKTIPLCSKILAEVESRFGKENIEKVVFTGTHGETIAKELGTFFEVETLALSYGLFELMPSSHAIISIGGHDSALFIVSPDGKGFVLEDFKLNEACAAGTGSFIDQQAERIYSDFPEFKDIPDPQLRMEKILSRFIADGKSSSRPANVACRCTVFTKSDMIHLQNKGISIGDIIAGLHEGVAKNFKSTLITNRKLRGPIAFVGGYASNELAKKAFEKTLGLEVVVPSHHTVVGALGAIISAVKSGLGKTVSSSEIANLSASSAFSASTTSPLACSKGSFVEREEATGFPSSKEKITVYLGFDIGSTTTKMVLISPSGEIYYKRYIPTEGQPVEAIKKAIKHFLESGIDRKRIDVLGVGTTGSGREVANLFVGADDVVNEVTAHAKGTTFYRPEVDTIFELGGQDAKYTLLKDGFLADFRMNKVCAAGTGSFLEETAKKLGIKINNEYENLAMSSKTPFKLAERCTVYMESDLMSFLQMGAKREDLLAGLSRAVVHNYLNRVVQDGKIGKVISFQGGPSLNKSVVAAFEAVIGKPVITLPHREVIGAIGAALHARDEIKSREAVGEKIKTKFKGWDVVEKKFVHSEEICRRNPQCHNQCKLQVYKVGEDEAIYGGECGMYESRVIVAKRTPDFSRIRQNLFFKSIEGKYRILNEGEVLPKSSSKPTIGIPRTLNFFQIGIFWVHLLEEMGFDVVISPETSNSIVDRGIEIMTCESCFPVKISHGHTSFLKEKVDYLFLPMMIEMEAPSDQKGYYCPYLEANTYMLQAALGLVREKVIMPAIYFNNGPDKVKKEIKSEFARLNLSFDSKRFDLAYSKAWEALISFHHELKRIGKKTLENLGEKRAIVVVGRPYSAYDSRTNLNLFYTFSRLGAIAIPQEFLDLDEEEIESDYPNMYWGFGDKILKAAKAINKDHRLFGLYLTSFACGPDSFILHFFNHEMARTNRPYLELELDEHSAGAGVETRLLAFLDVLKNQRNVQVIDKSVNIIPKKTSTPLSERTLYIPKMAEGSRCLAAAFQGVGHKAEVMPTYTKEGLEFAKSATSGKECFPCTVTTGDMFDLINTLKEKQNKVGEEIAFFMPETEGPCRFGQYNRLHRILLDRLGLDQIPILSPSSEDSYRCDGFFTKEQAEEFRKLAWQAIVFSDLVEKALWRTRPYEIVRGSADKAFERAMKRGIEAIERGGGRHLLKAVKRAFEDFQAIPRKNEKRPLVGIVGEIYVRTHKESNQELVRNLEMLGCETFTSSVSEWIEYTTQTSIYEAFQAAKKTREPSAFVEAAKCWFTGKYQRMVAWVLQRPFSNLLEKRFDHPTKHLLDLVEGIFSNDINGEAILSIGGALAFKNDGYNGVVNAMPFTCMPSTIATSILKVNLRNHIPYIDMIYDGTILPNRQTNLATFVYQAKQHERNKTQ